MRSTDGRMHLSLTRPSRLVRQNELAELIHGVEEEEEEDEEDILSLRCESFVWWSDFRAPARARSHECTLSLESGNAQKTE